MAEQEVDCEEIHQSMLTLMTQCKLNLSILLTRLQLRPQHTLNVYLIGSRLWGTATHSSDWDFVIVYRKWQGKATIHNGDIDASIMDEEEFAKRLKDHDFYALVCVWLPNEYKWKEELDAKKLLVSQGGVNKVALYNATATETERDWKIARKYIEKQNVDRCRKTIVHALRLLLLSIQIAREGHVTNYHEAYTYTQRMSEEWEQEWQHYDDVYTPIFSGFLRELKSLTVEQQQQRQ